jgi:segregation and condensation protein A
MVTDIKLQQFEGPLDLLLQLIEQEKMNISEVSISKVTEQFLNYLDKLEEDRSEALADFLVIATRLVYLKSKNLLPYLHPDEDEGPSLADQLKLYQQYVEASREIIRLWEQNNIAYGRLEPPVRPEGFMMPSNAHAQDLHGSLLLLLGRLKPLNPLPRITLDRAISVKQKISEIHNLIKKSGKMSFKDLLSGAQSKTELIVSFLAILELVKENFIHVNQPKSFEDMVIIKN